MCVSVCVCARLCLDACVEFSGAHVCGDLANIRTHIKMHMETHIKTHKDRYRGTCICAEFRACQARSCHVMCAMLSMTYGDKIQKYSKTQGVQGTVHTYALSTFVLRYPDNWRNVVCIVISVQV